MQDLQERLRRDHISREARTKVIFISVDDAECHGKRERATQCDGARFLAGLRRTGYFIPEAFRNIPGIALMDLGIRDRWRKEVVSSEEWKPHSDTARPVKPGEAGGFLVRSVQTGSVGYLKPVNARAGPSRASYEKVAADLAYEIGVNVPPVVLYQRPDAQPSQPKEVSISFAPRRAMRWGDLFNIGAADGGGKTPAPTARIKQMVADSCGVMALDAWLRNMDRNNVGNAILAYDGDEDPGQLFFVDFANSMDYDGNWSAGANNHQTFQRSPPPLLLAGNAVKSRVEETAKRIADLPDDTVAEIIRRIPDDFLAQVAREKLLVWLLWRKQNLVPSWGHWYAGN